MSDEDPPDDFPSEPPPPGSSKDTARERLRSRLESVIPDLLKRVIEVGVEKARESPDNVKHFVNDLKVPKEIAHYLFQQVDDTKNGLFRVVAKEMRDFLEHTNFSGEVQKLLTTVQFEVNTTIRFTPNDGREPRKQDGGGGGSEGGEREGGQGDGGGSSSSERPKGPHDAQKRDGDTSEDGRHPLPTPEIKTSVRIHRDDAGRSARRRGSRS